MRSKAPKRARIKGKPEVIATLTRAVPGLVRPVGAVRLAVAVGVGGNTLEVAARELRDATAESSRLQHRRRQEEYPEGTQLLEQTTGDVQASVRLQLPVLLLLVSRARSLPLPTRHRVLF